MKPKPAAPRYKKSAELQEFETAYNAKRYEGKNTPPAYQVKKHFSDKTANGLTAAIEAHLEFCGHFAARVNTTGIYDKRRGVYRTTNARKGMADISAVINGKPVQIEVKAGKDRPRTDQLQVKEEYEKAGGKYVFVHTFAEWIGIYKTL